MGSFKDVVGHKDILKYISSAVENNRVSHAYILNGERGSGKKMLANLFAMTLLCETGDNEPCGKCHSCKQAESGNHPDIIRVTHEKPNSISVDDIRTQVNNTVDLMENLEIPDYKADMCTAFAQGNMGRAIMLANSDHFNEIREEAVQLLKHINEMELNEIVAAVKNISVYKLEITDYLDIIMIWYRDVLLYKATKEIDKVVFKDQLQSIKEQARKPD